MALTNKQPPLTDRHIHDLVALVRQLYPGWDGFDHPPFATDEIAYKQTAVAKAAELLNQPALDGLLASNDFDTFLQRVEILCAATNLLWRRMPQAGDTAVLNHPQLPRADFCTQLRNLLHGDQPSPIRLQHFSDFLTGHQLPNRWPLPTYLLFLCHPHDEMFVKPRTAVWLLKYVGDTPATVSAPPDGHTYARILAAARQLYHALLPYGPADMVDVQSLVWVCAQQSEQRIGGLTIRGQIDLDIPPILAEQPNEAEETLYALNPATAVVREANTPAYQPAYTVAQCAQDTGYSAESLALWLQAIRRKQQAILYGPPGTGKTFMAHKLAQLLIAGGTGFVELIQFHPAYSYEDFMQGLRPQNTADGLLRYERVPGRFLQFCRQAQQTPNPCVLIIDEINRANLASVFGELMYLLEYREAEIPLAGNGRFSIPPNVFLLGTMNTADRSIALLDHALRRRFAFIHLPPNEQALRHFHTQVQTPTALVERLLALLRRLNDLIGDPHYHVGTTYFLQTSLADHLPAIWQMEIEPYLEEYFFDQPHQLDGWRWTAVGPQLLG